ncbi:unnamed protein product, partial [Pleuronectes platessa]
MREKVRGATRAGQGIEDQNWFSISAPQDAQCQTDMPFQAPVHSLHRPHHAAMWKEQHRTSISPYSEILHYDPWTQLKTDSCSVHSQHSGNDSPPPQRHGTTTFISFVYILSHTLLSSRSHQHAQFETQGPVAGLAGRDSTLPHLCFDPPTSTMAASLLAPSSFLPYSVLTLLI